MKKLFITLIFCFIISGCGCLDKPTFLKSGEIILVDYLKNDTVVHFKDKSKVVLDGIYTVPLGEIAIYKTCIAEGCYIFSKATNSNGQPVPMKESNYKEKDKELFELYKGKF